MMTALMAAVGLLPAAISHGIGSESSRPLARVVIGGILCAMIFSLWIFPLVFEWSYRKKTLLTLNNSKHTMKKKAKFDYK